MSNSILWNNEEGSIFAAQTLILKISSAVGVWIAGLILEWIRFPSGSDVLEVPAETIRNLGLVWIGANVAFYLLACLALMRFRMTRASAGKSEGESLVTHPSM